MVLDKNEVYIIKNGIENLLSSPTDIKVDLNMNLKVYLEQFLQLLIFTELAPLQTVVLKPNQSTGRFGFFKTRNESTQDIVIVDSTWNKTIVVVGKFAVRGHFRLQPCGKDRLERELIFINEFKKNGYVRQAKVLTQK